MELLNKIDELKAYLADVKKKFRFRRGRMNREQRAEFTYSLAKCRGELQTCMKSFREVISRQSRNICEGEASGADTLIQEQILWDSAIGYMMVRDAIFALETIGNYDAVAHAYELLDCAIRQISKKKTPLLGWLKKSNNEVRNMYGYVTSAASKSEKETLLDTFFEHLKQDGDIEGHLRNAAHENKNVDRMDKCFEATEDDEFSARRKRLQGMDAEPELTEEERQQRAAAVKKIRPPEEE